MEGLCALIPEITQGLITCTPTPPPPAAQVEDEVTL